MKFGLPVWYGNITSLEDEIERVGSLGFDYVEISLDYPWPELVGKPERKRLASIGKKAGVHFAFHAPPEGVEIASPSEAVRKAAVGFLKRQMKWCRDFKPAYFNFHCESGEDYGIYDNETEGDVLLLRTLESCRRSASELADFSGKAGFQSTLENTPDPVFGISANLDYVLSQGKCGAKLCLDLGHLEIVNRISKKALGKPDRTPEQWAKLAGERIKTIHLHAVRKGSDHYPVFSDRGQAKAAFSVVSKKTRATHTTIEIMKEQRGPVEKVSDRTLAKCLRLAREWAK